MTIELCDQKNKPRIYNQKDIGPSINTKSIGNSFIFIYVSNWSTCICIYFMQFVPELSMLIWDEGILSCYYTNRQFVSQLLVIKVYKLQIHTFWHNCSECSTEVKKITKCYCYSRLKAPQGFYMQVQPVAKMGDCCWDQRTKPDTFYMATWGYMVLTWAYIATF